MTKNGEDHVPTRALGYIGSPSGCTVFPEDLPAKLKDLCKRKNLELVETFQETPARRKPALRNKRKRENGERVEILPPPPTHQKAASRYKPSTLELMLERALDPAERIDSIVLYTDVDITRHFASYSICASVLKKQGIRLEAVCWDYSDLKEAETLWLIEHCHGVAAAKSAQRRIERWREMTAASDARFRNDRLMWLQSQNLPEPKWR